MFLKKYKKITIVVVILITILGFVSLFNQRYEPKISNNQKKDSTDSQTGESIAKEYTKNFQKEADDDNPTANTQKNNAAINRPKETPSSIKQSSIRKSVDKEYVYYPLLDANDPRYSSNWALQRMNTSLAWNISTGNNQTTIAIIDTGFALNHEDLIESWHINNGESGNTAIDDICWTGVSQNKKTNNCDDDDNGYIDDWRGWNFSLSDNNPMAGRTNPNGVGVTHGTETAGLAGAQGNNGIGITTLNWSTKLMPLQVLSDDGPGYTSDVIDAIYYAVDNGAQVINMSLGGNEPDPALESAVNYAYDNDVVVVAAAGNCGTGTEQGCTNFEPGAMMYPALNNHVLSVGATNSLDQRVSFSSYGPKLDIMAPGSGTISSPIWTSANSTSLYSTSLNGTSFASPQVASLASLIKSIRPSTSVDDITALILASATKPLGMNGALYTNQYGHGVIDAFSALRIAKSLNENHSDPTLLQTGNSKSEHSYSNNQTMNSGCRANGDSYCTIQLTSDDGSTERYLPYQKTSAQGLVGWSWNTTLIQAGQWQIKALQGDFKSSTYFINNK